jgi:predicted metalloprotease with PDZ domain
VAEKGIAGLPPALRRQLPQTIERDIKGYRERIEAVFGHHPGAKERDIEHFIEVQLTWDEGMAEAAANYLAQHPDRTMVVLAGAGHVVEGTGIPQRLQRRLAVPMATVLQLDSGLDLSAEPADYVILGPAQTLPPSGLIGVVLKQVDQGMEIMSIAEGSHAGEAGVRKGDRLIEINGAPIRTLADVRLQLWNRKPGDRVRLALLRGKGGFVRRLEVDVVLK